MSAAEAHFEIFARSAQSRSKSEQCRGHKRSAHGKTKHGEVRPEIERERQGRMWEEREKKAGAGRSVTCCPSSMDFQRGDAPGMSVSATCARNAVSNMAWAWDTSAPGRKRRRSRSQLMLGSGRHSLSAEVAVTGTHTSTDTSGSIPKNPGCATPTTV